MTILILKQAAKIVNFENKIIFHFNAIAVLASVSFLPMRRPIHLCDPVCLAGDINVRGQIVKLSKGRRAKLGGGGGYIK